jgi:hydrogenase maturation protease
MVAPLLVFGWGNASRGDDALGPLFVERLCERLGDAATGCVDFLDDYQLQPEHALDLVGRERVLFVDASLDGAAPFEVRAVLPRRDDSFSTHAMSPAAVLQVFTDVQGHAPPPCTLLAIRGERFELGAPPGEAALTNLSAALDWAVPWFRAPAR